METSIPQDMRALCLYEYGGDLKWTTLKIPTPGEYQVLARTICSGICHTDLHTITGELGKNPSLLPIIPGHEGVGTVVSVGRNVTKFSLNDRIGVGWLGKSCFNCHLCAEGHYNLCQSQYNTGFSLSGSWAEYFIADERFAVKIPDALSSEAAAPMLCAGVTTYSALKKCKISEGKRIVISGACGGLGNMAVKYAKSLKLEVVALDIINDSNEKLLRELGADFIVDVKNLTSESLAEKLKQLDTSGKPIEAALIDAPALSSVTDAVHYVAPGGTIICIALPTGSYSIPCKAFVLKALKMVGSIVGTPEELQEALDIAASGKIIPYYVMKDKSDIVQVLANMRDGRTTGRTVVMF